MSDSGTKREGPLTNLRKVFIAVTAYVAVLLIVAACAAVGVLSDVIVCAALGAVVSICTAAMTALYGEHKATMVASSQQSIAATNRSLVSQVAAEAARLGVTGER